MTDSETYIFRAVMEDERAQIERDGVFKNPLGIEVKYFGIFEMDAVNFARSAFGKFNDSSCYHIVKVRVESEHAANSILLDRCVRSITLETHQLIGLKPEILNYSLRYIK